MANQQTVNLQVNPKLKPMFDTELNHNHEFLAEYERFEKLLTVDEHYLIGLTVGGQMRLYEFHNGDAITYALVREAFDNGTKTSVIEIEDFVRKETREALKQNQGLLKKCWAILQRGVARADSIQLWIEIALAIGILSILFTSKIVSSDVPEIKNRPSVPEQQAPKLPENKQIKP